MRLSQLEHNIVVHNKIARKYEAVHGEIYNDIEQSRLQEKLKMAASLISTGSDTPTALDFGCGAGNLTKHLSDLGIDVVAADVSTGFLELVSSRTYASKVKTFQLNGVDLQGINDASLDMVAMYSVLHHVPDYLSLMREFARVLKPGGIIYIDHEASSAVWGEDLAEFRKEIKQKSRTDIKKFFVFTNYVDRFIRMLVDSKYQREGDIHVFPDDHIEWNLLKKELAAHNVTVVSEEDYLLYRRNYDKEVYNLWKNKVGDMHLLIGRKI